MQLKPCSSCRRHVRHDVGTCPFCKAAIAESALPESEAPRLARGMLMTLASAGFAATLGACYGGAPRYYQPAPPPPPPPPGEQVLEVKGDALEACNKAIAEAKKNGCTVDEAGGGVADIACKDLNVRIEPREGAVLLHCREPLDTCRSGVQKLISPTPPIEPIAPPP
ncbi:MAG: hypothetical protein ACXWP4_00315 [Polyangiales bacterium]